MSCNGCRVLRRGCSEHCILRPCLDWIQTPQAQAYATLFVSKFFGRSDLMTFIAAVPHSKRAALFQSLLFEACGRAVNPVNGAVGLLSTGNWHICQAAVDTVLSGGIPRPVSVGNPPASAEAGVETFARGSSYVMQGPYAHYVRGSPPPPRGILYCMDNTASMGSGLSEVSPGVGSEESGVKQVGSKRPKLLKLFD